MGERQKKPGWLFWTVVSVGIPLMYVMSYGPACWLTNRRVDRWRCPRAMVVYWPLGRAFQVMGLRRQHAGNPLSVAGHEALMWWMTAGVSKGGSIITPTSTDLTKVMVVEPLDRPPQFW